MSQTHLDPRALHEFARFLRQHARLIQERTTAARSNVKNLSSVWQDARYNEFVQTFDVAMKDIDDFLAAADKQTKYIDRKAALGERFLRKG